jgi:hypothetical protein
MRAVAFAVAVAAVVWAAGCSSESGAKRYRVSGEARFNGAPIPYGDVLFTPDGAKQNSGPQGIANIRDGKFDTAGAEGKGFAGGPTVVRVTGLSGPPDQGGKLLCEYEYTVDLPRQDSTLTIEVPASAAPKKGGTTPDI